MSQTTKRRREDSIAGSKIPLPKVSTKPKPASAIPSVTRNAVPATPSDTSRTRLSSMQSSDLKKLQDSKLPSAKPTPGGGRMKSISNPTSLRTPLSNRTNGPEANERRTSISSNLKTPSAVSNRLSSVGRTELKRMEFQLDETPNKEGAKRRRVTSAEGHSAALQANAKVQAIRSGDQHLGSDFATDDIDALEVDFTEVAPGEKSSFEERNGTEEAENKGLLEKLVEVPSTEEADVVENVEKSESERDAVEEKIEVEEIKPEGKDDRSEQYQRELEAKLQELEINWTQKLESLAKQKEEEVQKIRATLQARDSELRQVILLSEESLSQTEELEKRCRILEQSKQEEIAKAIFSESEKYERILATLRAELKNQEEIKSKAEEMDRTMKDQEAEASVLLAELKEELAQAKDKESKSLEAIKSLEESMQNAESAWRDKFLVLQQSGERIILEQSEKYEKLIAELEAQLNERKKCMKEQIEHADDLAEQSNQSDSLWMLKVEEIHKEKEILEQLLEQERSEAKRVAEGFAQRIGEMEARWQANSQELRREKEELSVMSAMQKEGYEKLLAELRAELNKFRERDNASSEARFALEEELTEKAVAMEADWRKRFEDLANKKEEEMQHIQSQSVHLEHNLAELQSQLESYKVKEAEWGVAVKALEDALKRIEEIETTLKDKEQRLSQAKDEIESSKYELEKVLSEANADSNIARNRENDLSRELEELKQQAASLEVVWKEKYENLMNQKASEIEELMNAHKATEAAKEELQAEVKALKESELSLANEKEELEEELKQKAEAIETEWKAKYDELANANESGAHQFLAQKGEYEATVSQLKAELELAKQREVAISAEKEAMEEESLKKIASIEVSWNERLQELSEAKSREISTLSSQQGQQEQLISELRLEIEQLKQKESLDEQSRQHEAEQLKLQTAATEARWEAKYKELSETKELELQNSLGVQRVAYESEMEILRGRIESVQEREASALQEKEEIQREAQRKIEAIDAEWTAKFDDILKNKEGEVQGILGQIQERHEKVVSELKEELQGYKERITVVVNEKEALEQELLGRLESLESSWKDKYEHLLKQKEEESKHANVQKEEFDRIVSELRNSMDALSEENAKIVSEKESLESELRASIRSIESSWNERYLDLSKTKEEERMAALEGQKEEYEKMFTQLQSEIESLKEREMFRFQEKSESEADWKRQLEFMEHSWNERLEEACMAKDEEAQKLMSIQKEEHEKVVLALQTEIEIFKEQEIAIAKERKEEIAEMQRKMEMAVAAQDARWTEHLEAALNKKEREAQDSLLASHEKVIAELNAEIASLRATTSEEHKLALLEFKKQKKSLKTLWKQRCRAVTIQKEEEMKEIMNAQQTEHERIAEALQAALDASRARESALSLERSRIEEELSGKLKAIKDLELTWAERGRAAVIQKEEEMKESMETQQAEYNRVVEALQAALDAAREREAIVAREKKLLEGQLAIISKEIENKELAWSERYRTAAIHKEEEMKETMEIQQEESNRVIEALQTALNAARGREADAALEKKRIEEELSGKAVELKDMESVWAERCRTATIQKEAELQESIETQQEEYNRIVEALQAALDAAREREAVAALEKKRVEEELLGKIKEVESAWSDKFEAMTKGQEEAITKLKESLVEETRRQVMQQAQEEMERVRQQTVVELEAKEKELSEARLSLAQQQRSNINVNRRVQTIFTRLVAIQSLGQGSVIEQEPATLAS